MIHISGHPFPVLFQSPLAAPVLGGIECVVDVADAVVEAASTSCRSVETAAILVRRLDPPDGSRKVSPLTPLGHTTERPTVV